MKEIVADVNLIAYCGLYCGACPRYLKEKCPGCHDNVKAGWCKLRTCCMDAGFSSCAQCKDFPDPNDCGKFNNLISKIFGLVFNSNRQACILAIRDQGLESFAQSMADNRKVTMKRFGKTKVE